MILGLVTILVVFLGGYFYGIWLGWRAGAQKGYEYGLDRGEKRAIAMLL